MTRYGLDGQPATRRAYTAQLAVLWIAGTLARMFAPRR